MDSSFNKGIVTINIKFFMICLEQTDQLKLKVFIQITLLKLYHMIPITPRYHGVLAISKNVKQIKAANKKSKM